MKKLLLLILFISLTVNAAYQPGSKCGLTDEANDGWTEGKSMDLGTRSAVNISSLPALTQQQIILAAKSNASSEGGEFRNTLDAVNYLRSVSEDGAVFVADFIYQSRGYTHVFAYPGGNPVGLIFRQGTLQIIADNQDGTIGCR